MAILTARDRNVFVTNSSTQYPYTPNATFDSHFGKSRLVHGISVGGGGGTGDLSQQHKMNWLLLGLHLLEQHFYHWVYCRGRVVGGPGGGQCGPECC